jgi:transposase
MVNATDPDLLYAPRVELVALIQAQHTTLATQEATIATLSARIADLERRLGSSGGGGMPGTKPAAATRSKATGAPRRKRPRGFARRRMTPTRQVEHAADQCPHCATALTGGWVVRRREVIDLPAAPVEVVEHVIRARRCPTCTRVVRPRVDLSEVVAGQQRLSARVVSLIATLREVGRLPVRTIQWLLATVHDLQVSAGTIVAASARVAEMGTAAVAAIRDQVRTSAAVAMDETGWRENGVNSYVWIAATPTARYFVHGRRTGAMVDTILGDQFAGAIGCDFYAAYHHYPGAKQRCWAHLLREMHDLTVAYPGDGALARWKRAVQRLYQVTTHLAAPGAAAAAAAATATATGPAPPRGQVQTQQGAEARLAALCQPVADDPTAVHAKLCRRILRHLSELFVFVTEPAVPSTNNLAERSLRPVVTARKISGGTRSPAGTATKMATASLFGTWQLQGHNPLLACQTLLLAPSL